MKALTLHQPWASLIACGAKSIETRSWCPSSNVIGQRIAIHAGKVVVARGLEKSLREDWVEFFEAVENCLGADWRAALPRGAVVATAVLESYFHVPTYYSTEAERVSVLETQLEEAGGKDNEFVFGDYSGGRVAWVLSDVVACDPPLPARGYQGLWEWKPEDHVVNLLADTFGRRVV